MKYVERGGQMSVETELLHSNINIMLRRHVTVTMEMSVTALGRKRMGSVM